MKKKCIHLRRKREGIVSVSARFIQITMAIVSMVAVSKMEDSNKKALFESYYFLSFLSLSNN